MGRRGARGLPLVPPGSVALTAPKDTQINAQDNTQEAPEGRGRHQNGISNVEKSFKIFQNGGEMKGVETGQKTMDTEFGKEMRSSKVLPREEMRRAGNEVISKIITEKLS